jgi:hypothetical protein
MLAESIRSRVPFITKKNRFVVVGIGLIWLISGFVLYALMYLFREVFRLLSAYMGVKEYVILTDAEYYFFNILFAELALIVAFGWLSAPAAAHPGFRRRQRKGWLKILNAQNSLSMYAFFWFVKLASVYGVLLIVTPVHRYVSLYQEYHWVLISIPLVLFVYQWMPVLLTYGKSGFKLMAVTFMLIILASFGFSMVPLIDYKTLNARALGRSVQYNYTVNLPDASQGRLFGFPPYRTFNIHLGYPRRSDDQNSPVVILDDAVELAAGDWMKLVAAIDNMKAGLWEYEDVSVLLYIDKRVPMRYVTDVLKSLSLRLSQRCFVALDMTEEDRYSYRRRVFGLRMPVVDSTINRFIELARRGDIDLADIDTPIAIHSLHHLAGEVLITIEVAEDAVYVNGNAIDERELNSSALAFISEARDRSIAIHGLESVSFGTWLRVYNEVIKAYDLNRQEMVRERFPRIEYDPLRPEEQVDPDVRRYVMEKRPITVGTLSAKEMELLKIMRSQIKK